MLAFPPVSDIYYKQTDSKRQAQTRVNGTGRYELSRKIPEKIVNSLVSI